METFNLDLESSGVPYEADIVAFIVGRHNTSDDEAMEPFYHGRSAAVSQIIFETTVGRQNYIILLFDLVHFTGQALLIVLRST